MSNYKGVNGEAEKFLEDYFENKSNRINLMGNLQINSVDALREYVWTNNGLRLTPAQIKEILQTGKYEFESLKEKGAKNIHTRGIKITATTSTGDMKSQCMFTVPNH